MDDAPIGGFPDFADVSPSRRFVSSSIHLDKQENVDSSCHDFLVNSIKYNYLVFNIIWLLTLYGPDYRTFSCNIICGR